MTPGTAMVASPGAPGGVIADTIYKKFIVKRNKEANDVFYQCF